MRTRSARATASSNFAWASACEGNGSTPRRSGISNIGLFWLTLKMSRAHPERGRRLERRCHERLRTDGERWLWRLVRLFAGAEDQLGCGHRDNHPACNGEIRGRLLEQRIGV